MRVHGLLSPPIWYPNLVKIKDKISLFWEILEEWTVKWYVLIVTNMMGIRMMYPPPLILMFTIHNRRRMIKGRLIVGPLDQLKEEYYTLLGLELMEIGERRV